MKQHIYNCNSTRVTAQAAMREHLSLYPDGLKAIYEGRSKPKPYYDLGYKIYETATTIVVNEIGGKL